MPEYIFIIFTMIIASFIQGMTGFGFSMIAIPIMATFINIKQAVPLSVSIALITVIIVSFQLRGHLNLKRLMPMVVGLVPGIAIGAFLLKNLPDNIIKFRHPSCQTKSSLHFFVILKKLCFFLSATFSFRISMLQEIEKIREFHFVKKCKLGNEGCLNLLWEFFY